MHTTTTKQEATAWRDTSLSDWHRSLDHNCPCTDLDCLVSNSTLTENTYVEFGDFKPTAIIDYKCGSGNYQFTNSMRVQKTLADMAQLPFYVVSYERSFRYWNVRPMNDLAIEKLKDGMRHPETLDEHISMTERQYVRFLRYLQGYRLSDADAQRFFHTKY